MPAAAHYVQLAVEAQQNAEATPGAVSSTVFYHPLTEFSWNMPPQVDDRGNELRGFSDPMFPDIVGWEPTECGANARLYGNALGLYLTALLGQPTTTPGAASGVEDPDEDVIPLGAHRHVWQSDTIASVPRTLQAILGYVDQGEYFRIRGLTCDGLTLGFDDNIANFEASLKGLYTARIANPSLTPVYDAASIKPFVRGHHSVETWLAASAQATGITYNFEGPVEPVPGLGGTKWPTGWDRTGAGAVTLGGTLDLRYVDGDDWLAFVNGTTWAVKSRYRHDQVIGATDYPYSAWIEGFAAYSGYTAEPVQHVAKRGASAPFVFGRDATAGYAFRVTVVNGVPSYSSAWS